MRRGRKPRHTQYPGDPQIAGGFRSYLIDFLEAIRVNNGSEATVKNHRVDLGYFIVWCEERAICTPQEVTRAHLERYRLHVYQYRKSDGQPLAFSGQRNRISAVRVFFKWLTRQHHLLFNPASELDTPRVEKRLPRCVLTVAEIEQVINVPDTAEPFGLRDRAMLETLYSTGLRRQELINLTRDDLDLERGTLMVRQGKNKKDRVVPVGSRAVAWLDRYLREVRPDLANIPDDGTLFLSASREKLSGNRLSEMVKTAIEQANLERSVRGASCHLFRHACATHMLENGADIRFIQALLGHAEINTTAIYTQVSIVKLKEVHDKTHPARLAKVRRAKPASGSPEEEQ